MPQLVFAFFVADVVRSLLRECLENNVAKLDLKGLVVLKFRHLCFVVDHQADLNS